MNKYNNPHLTGNAQTLRKKMTKEEKHLWYDFLSTLNVTINRQKVIGRYIVDFYCAEKQIVIEIDGSQHFEDDGIKKDRERDLFFESQGIKVLRYTNLDINLRFKEVCEDIYNHLSLL